MIGGASYQCDIAAYDKDEDLAVLRVRTGRPFYNIAKLYPRDRVKELVCFMPVVTVGCGMGNKPVVTFGYISGFGYEIEKRDFMLCTASSIFGNSGGATFLHDSGELVGVPARITVTSFGFSADVVTHLGFSIPIWRVYDFLEDQILDFIYDPKKTSIDCHKEKDRKREEDQRHILQEEIKRSD